ncbi:MAG: low molecular weight phosphotyrosine protein phosphatase, partial [Propionibacteriaceae bacterium]|nr:low molecular weight phosphotyrosine protein phosphatase [Propionibacteriaceae bacterium]
MTAEPYVIFICLGNICRSAMAERVARHWADEAGLAVRFTSAGISDEEQGRP